MAGVARAGGPFDLKSTSLSGLALLLRTPDLAQLTDAMGARFGADVFGHEAVVIDLSALPEDAEPFDFAALLELLQTHRLRAAGARGGDARWMQAAFDAGLGDVGEDEVLTTARAPAIAVAAEESPAVSVPAEPAPIEPSATALPASTPGGSAPTLVVDKPLRSGQQVYAKGGDLVVLATVNVGAEVIADGHIHVYGPLRGKAVAGAKGNTDARIFSTCMEPQLLSIAGTYRTTENPLPADVLGRPAQIRLDGERLVFEPLD